VKSKILDYYIYDYKTYNFIILKYVIVHFAISILSINMNISYIYANNNLQLKSTIDYLIFSENRKSISFDLMLLNGETKINWQNYAKKNGEIKIGVIDSSKNSVISSIDKSLKDAPVLFVANGIQNDPFKYQMKAIQSTNLDNLIEVTEKYKFYLINNVQVKAANILFTQPVKYYGKIPKQTKVEIYDNSDKIYHDISIIKYQIDQISTNLRSSIDEALLQHDEKKAMYQNDPNLILTIILSVLLTLFTAGILYILKKYFEDVKDDQSIMKEDHSKMERSMRKLNDSSNSILIKTSEIPTNFLNILRDINIDIKNSKQVELELNKYLQQNIISEIKKYGEMEREYIKEFDKIKKRDRILSSTLISLEKDIKDILIKEKDRFSKSRNQTLQHLQNIYANCNDLLEKIYKKFNSNRRYLTAESIAEALAYELSTKYNIDFRSR